MPMNLPLLRFLHSDSFRRILRRERLHRDLCTLARAGEARPNMQWKSRLLVGILTALAMMLLTYALPRGGAVREAALVQFPMTAGVWAIFVLLFVKLK